MLFSLFPQNKCHIILDLLKYSSAISRFSNPISSSPCSFFNIFILLYILSIDSKVNASCVTRPSLSVYSNLSADNFGLSLSAIGYM